MNRRQEILSGILNNHFEPGSNPGNSISLIDLKKAGLVNEVSRIWKKLGGQGEDHPLEFGGWDLLFAGLIVELDEEQHFNRYRNTTLGSFLYHIFNGCDITDYTKYCVIHEPDCLRKSSWGKYWTSPSSEKYFGHPGFNGNLTENGSPRWKQRAFYDYLRDVFAISYQIRLVRVSIYDKLIICGRIRTIGELLDENCQGNDAEILKFIDQKIKVIR